MDYRYYYENGAEKPASRRQAADRVRKTAAVGLMAALALAFGATALITPAGALTGPGIVAHDPHATQTSLPRSPRPS